MKARIFFVQVRTNHLCSIANKDIRVRFAPSPTGDLHLGSLRTALYNFLFARHHKGQFVLRIEDTDQTRFVPNSIDNIHRVLDQYGLGCDEGPRIGGEFGPYEQSSRLDLYEKRIQQLIDTNHAYRCFCSESRLALLRKDALRQNSIPKYDRKCRGIDTLTSRQRAESGEPFVVRFKTDKQDVTFKDEVFGSITQSLDESDMVLLKSDGFPTYHFANIVDDHAMRISHVIRGMEWLSSTGKHILLYRAFNWDPPVWVHLPLITRDGRKKLSKREQDAFVDYYKELGSLPIAVLNFLIRNGSGISEFDSTRLYTLEEMVDNFNVKLIGRRNLQLDYEWLERYSRMAFQRADFASVLYPAIVERMRNELQEFNIPNAKYLEKVVLFLKENEEHFAYLSSLIRGEYRWFLTRPSSATQIIAKFDPKVALIALTTILSRDMWTLDQFKLLAEELSLTYSHLLSIIRISLIGNTSGPPIMELVNFFGKVECRDRIEQMINYLKQE